MKNYYKCQKCKDSISKFSIGRHLRTCKGINKNLRNKQKRNSVNILKISIKINDNLFECLKCHKQFTKMGIGSHYFRSHIRKYNSFIDKNGKILKPWNTGLSKVTDERVKKSSEKLNEGYKSGRLKGSFVGKTHSKETKIKLSNSLKKAHKENRAWNIGKSRWNNKPSYPESFFMKVIENDFDDKNYKREFSFDRYSLDFAWIDKKKCIEIDGEQHERFQEIKDRDLKKNEILKLNKWKILRIKWKEMFNNPKKYIRKANLFIGK